MDSCKDLLDAIVNFDCKPGVFSVTVKATDHTDGYGAQAEFRSGHMDGRAMYQCGSTPLVALENLLEMIIDKRGKCPHCGRYPNQRDQDGESGGA